MARAWGGSPLHVALTQPVHKNGQAARPAQRWPLSTTQHSPADANTSSILPFLWGALWFPRYTWAQGSTQWRTGSALLSGCLYLQHAHTHTHTTTTTTTSSPFPALPGALRGWWEHGDRTSSVTHSEVTPALGLCSWPATWTWVTVTTGWQARWGRKTGAGTGPQSPAHCGQGASRVPACTLERVLSLHQGKFRREISTKKEKNIC